MSVTPQRSWAPLVLWFWVGLVAFGFIGFIGFFAGAALAEGGGPAQAAAAVALALATLVPAVALIRRGRTLVGSGLLVGYALVAVASGGQCTFWSQSADYGFLAGAFVYVIALGVVLVAAVVAAVIDAFRSTRHGS